MRIIAGSRRGRPLKAPQGLGTRPTIDRVREALFSILGPVDDLVVIDCYAGTGAMGLEAASRGARDVTLIEADRNAHRVLCANIASLGLQDSCRAWHCRVEALARRYRASSSDTAGLGIDLVLADPPWPIAQQAAEVLVRELPPLLAPNARVVIGHPKRSPVALPENAPFELETLRSWGDSGLSFFTYRAR